MGIIELEENAKIGDKFRVVLQPKIDLIGTGTFEFSEDSIRGILETVDAIYFEWQIREITFPIIGGVRSVSILIERVSMFNQAGQALVVLVSGLAGALAFAFILFSVDKVTENVVVPAGSGFSFTVLGAVALMVGGVIVYFKIR